MNSAPLTFYYLMIVQFFYSFGVTLITAVLPAAQAGQIVAYTNSSNLISFTTLSNSMVSSVGSQTTLPLIEFGALIFYSTNIFINLVVNFFTAIPQMLTAVLNFIFIFVAIDPTLKTITLSTGLLLFTVIYYYILLMYILGARANPGVYAR